MPLSQSMDYTGRTMKERTPHQVAVALTGVLEAFAHAIGRENFDVSEHTELEAALREAGEIFLDAVTPGNPPHRPGSSGA